MADPRTAGSSNVFRQRSSQAMAASMQIRPAITQIQATQVTIDGVVSISFKLWVSEPNSKHSSAQIQCSISTIHHQRPPAIRPQSATGEILWLKTHSMDRQMPGSHHQRRPLRFGNWPSNPAASHANRSSSASSIRSIRGHGRKSIPTGRDQHHSIPSGSRPLLIFEFRKPSIKIAIKRPQQGFHSSYGTTCSGASNRNHPSTDSSPVTQEANATAYSFIAAENFTASAWLSSQPSITNLKLRQ